MYEHQQLMMISRSLNHQALKELNSPSSAVIKCDAWPKRIDPPLERPGVLRCLAHLELSSSSQEIGTHTRISALQTTQSMTPPKPKRNWSRNWCPLKIYPRSDWAQPLAVHIPVHHDPGWVMAATPWLLALAPRSSVAEASLAARVTAVDNGE